MRRLLRPDAGTSHVASSGGSSAPVPSMVDPGRGRGTLGAPGEGRYHWTVTVFDETGVAAEGYTGELAEARSRAEDALLAYVEGGEPSSRGRGIIG
jgi:hypothetical protein